MVETAANVARVRTATLVVSQTELAPANPVTTVNLVS